MKAERIFRKNPDFVTREIESNIILMPLCKSSKDIDYIYSLNETAGAVWNLIDGKRKLQQIKDKLLRSYEVSQGKVSEQFYELIKDLKEIKAIQ